MTDTTTLHTFQVGDRVALADDDGLVPHLYEIGQEGKVDAIHGATIRVKWDKGGESHLHPWRLALVDNPRYQNYSPLMLFGLLDLCLDCGCLVGSREIHDREAHRVALGDG